MKKRFWKNTNPCSRRASLESNLRIAKEKHTFAQRIEGQHEVSELDSSTELYHQVRGGFATQGTSLSKWCSLNGTKIQNARACLVGTWNGPKGKQLRAELVIASGIAPSQSIDDATQTSGRDVA